MHRVQITLIMAVFVLFYAVPLMYAYLLPNIKRDYNKTYLNRIEWTENTEEENHYMEHLSSAVAVIYLN